MNFELNERKHSTNGAASCLTNTVNIDNGSSQTFLRNSNGGSIRGEADGLLQEQPDAENGEAPGDPEDTQSERPPQQVGVLCRVVEELKKPVYWKFKVWMIFLIVFVVIIAVIIISLASCAAMHNDKDEKYDPSLFTVPQQFNGSFQMPNMVFTEELVNLSSNECQKLSEDLREKESGMKLFTPACFIQLSDLYRSSTALGRYFSSAHITAFRNGSVISDYVLTFMLPEAEQEPLRRFVVSREMVFNVLRQFLFDQETPESDPAYIDPVSLVML